MLPDLREYLAAERTVLAYIRTGLSMMGIGFVIARFGLFLRLFQLNTSGAGPVSTFTPSVWLGTAMVTMGSIVTVLSARQYWLQVKQLNQKMNGQVDASSLALGLALILSAIGFLLAAYLLVSSIN